MTGPSEANSDLIRRLLAAGHDERLATGQLYLDAAAALRSATPASEYICKCGVRIVPHRCQTGEEF